MADDWKEKMQKASDTAAKKADAATDDELRSITAEADELKKIFADLQLADPKTYDEFVKIVDEATQKNESIANVLTRLKTLGAAAKGLATNIGNVFTGGGLSRGAGVLKSLLDG